MNGEVKLSRSSIIAALLWALGIVIISMTVYEIITWQSVRVLLDYI